MLAWMLYVVIVSALLSLGAFLAERAARLKRAGTRWIWLTAIVASLALPTLVSSVAIELPDVLAHEGSGVDRGEKREGAVLDRRFVDRLVVLILAVRVGQ